MVWIHGGGYTYSSGTTLVADGTNLARTGDVTVVCLNHRLNIFGHLYLDEAGGAKYAGSVIWACSILSLRWSGSATTSPTLEEIPEM